MAGAADEPPAALAASRERSKRARWEASVRSRRASSLTSSGRMVARFAWRAKAGRSRAKASVRASGRASERAGPSLSTDRAGGRNGVHGSKNAPIDWRTEFARSTMACGPGKGIEERSHASRRAIVGSSRSASPGVRRTSLSNSMPSASAAWGGRVRAAWRSRRRPRRTRRRLRRRPRTVFAADPGDGGLQGRLRLLQPARGEATVHRKDRGCDAGASTAVDESACVRGRACARRETPLFFASLLFFLGLAACTSGGFSSHFAAHPGGVGAGAASACRSDTHARRRRGSPAREGSSRGGLLLYRLSLATRSVSSFFLMA